jgi:hypothetical protein
MVNKLKKEMAYEVTLHSVCLCVCVHPQIIFVFYAVRVKKKGCD